MKISRTIALLSLSIIISFNFSFGQTEHTSPFELDFTKEAIIIGAGTAAGVTSMIILFNLDPLTQQQIDELNPDNVNSFDRSFIGPYQDDYVSDVLLYSSYLLPLTFLTTSETKNDFGDLALMYGEVLLLNASINTVAKGLTERIRPFVYDKQSPLEEKTKIDAKLSFYSGHVSTTASTCFFTAKVFNEYLTDNTTKVLIWSAAALIPAVTGFSRISTHNHFPTDVIVGYIVGAAIGYLVPLIHKNESNDSNTTDPADFAYKPLLGFQFKF